MNFSKTTLIIIGVLIIFSISFAIYFLGGFKFFNSSSNTAKAEIQIPKPTAVDLQWNEEVTNAPWGPRDSGETFVFQNKMWLMGGLDGSKVVDGDNDVRYWEARHKQDIWNTEDGVNWVQVATTSPWGARRSMSVVEFKGKLWMMGGWRPVGGYTNDIWSSVDGINWKLEVKNADWPAREGQLVEVFKGKMWLIGGVNYAEKQTKNDVWYSENGVDWTEVKNIPWSSRWDHAIAVFKGKLFLTGGMDLNDGVFNDEWVTEDGINWTQVTDKAVWPTRQGHALISYNGYLWNIGRLNDDENGGINDVWFSKNGVDWEKTRVDPKWLGREDEFATVFKNKIWIFGGMNRNWEWSSDVWSSEYRF